MCSSCSHHILYGFALLVQAMENDHMGATLPLPYMIWDGMEWIVVQLHFKRTDTGSITYCCIVCFSFLVLIEPIPSIVPCLVGPLARYFNYTSVKWSFIRKRLQTLFSLRCFVACIWHRLQSGSILDACRHVGHVNHKVTCLFIFMQ